MNNFTINMIGIVVPFCIITLVVGFALGPILRRLNELRDRLDAQASHHS